MEVDLTSLREKIEAIRNVSPMHGQSLQHAIADCFHSLLNMVEGVGEYARAPDEKEPSDPDFDEAAQEDGVPASVVVASNPNTPQPGQVEA